MADTELSGVSNATDQRSKSGDTHGRTAITDNAVATIAAIAVRETEGVHSAGRGVSKFLGAVTGQMSRVIRQTTRSPGCGRGDRSTRPSPHPLSYRAVI